MFRMLLLTLCLFPLLQADETIYRTLEDAHAKNSILLFYTTWCPACKKSVELLNDVQQHYPQSVKILGINLDDGVLRKNYLKETPVGFDTVPMTQQQAAGYGVSGSVPVIYVLDADLQIVKRYFKVPNPSLFMRLIGRLQAGYLENGTLPVEERIDLWQRKRN